MHKKRLRKKIGKRLKNKAIKNVASTCERKANSAYSRSAIDGMPSFVCAMAGFLAGMHVISMMQKLACVPSDDFYRKHYGIHPAQQLKGKAISISAEYNARHREATASISKSLEAKCGIKVI